MTRVLEPQAVEQVVPGDPFFREALNAHPKTDAWELMGSFQRLQQTYREGRVGEREAAFADYVLQVRRQGGDPKVHFHYALGLLALGSAQRDPERSSAFQRILNDHWFGSVPEDLESSFRKGLERILGLALDPRAGNRGERLDRVREFVRMDFQRPVRLEWVAAEFGFSTSALGRAFNARFGKSFSAFLRDLRVGKAKELLAEGCLPVEQVSRECGFKNFHYFFEVFKKSTGMTPQKFRKAHSGLADKF